MNDGGQPFMNRTSMARFRENQPPICRRLVQLMAAMIFIYQSFNARTAMATLKTADTYVGYINQLKGSLAWLKTPASNSVMELNPQNAPGQYLYSSTELRCATNTVLQIQFPWGGLTDFSNTEWSKIAPEDPSGGASSAKKFNKVTLPSAGAVSQYQVETQDLLRATPERSSQTALTLYGDSGTNYVVDPASANTKPADWQGSYAMVSSSPSTGGSGWAEAARQMGIYAQPDIQRELKAARMAELYQIYTTDPWRVMKGQTNVTQGPGWVEFQGWAREVTPDGILFCGEYGQILTIHPNDTNNDAGTTGQDLGNQLFWIKHFPKSISGQAGFVDLLAREDGTHAYTNSAGQVVSIPAFDYGTPCVKIWSPEEIAAAEQIADTKKQAIKERILKANLEAADRGDAYGLLRMAERYRDGEGVIKDLTKAKEYFGKAADAGSETAVTELKKLPAE